MRRILTFTLLIAASLHFASPMFVAHAGENKWKAGIRAGLSVPTSSIVVDRFDSEADLGPIINSQFLYRFNKYLHAGSMVEFEYHSVSSPIAHDGDAYIFSLFPLVAEIGPGRIKNWEPYGTIGLGFNVNNFASDSGNDVEADTTFALRAGAGVDYFLTENLALNTEVAWKLNDGEAFFEEVGYSDFHASTLSVLFGVRAVF